MGELEIHARGGDPLYEMTPGQAGTSVKAQMEYMSGLASQRNTDVHVAADTAGWGQLYGFMKEVMDQYRAENNAPLQKLHEFSSPEDQFRLQMQLRPIEVDPNRVAEMRQLAVSIDTAIKGVDPRMSFWSHPDFKGVAAWLNREAGKGQQGFMTSGPQEMGMAADVSEAGLAGAEAGVDMGLGMAYTMWSWGADGLNAIGVEAPQPPTNYVIDERTGELIVDTARPNPGLIEAIVALRNHSNEKAYFEEITALKGSRHMQQFQAGAGVQILRGAAQIVGMMGLPPIGKFKGAAGGFAPALKAMQVGTGLGQRLVHKGLVRLGASTTKRSAKVMQAIGGVVGAATGNAGAMALAYGRHDDYATQAVHGAAIAPILIVMGALGKGAERMLRTRPNMPSGVRKKVQDSMAAAVGGGVEGYAFGVMDDIQTRGLWEFLKDPTPASWTTYLGNMAGMAFLKGAGAGAAAEQRRAGDEKVVRQEAEKASSFWLERVQEAQEAGAPPEVIAGLAQEFKTSLTPEAQRIGAAERGRRPLVESREDVEKVIVEHAGPTGRQRREIEAVSAPREAPEAVRRAERRGVGSFQAGPERQVEAVTGKTMELEALREIVSGKRGRAGIRVLGKRIFSKRGDPVQVDFKEGKTEGAEGISKKIGVVRSKIGNDIPVMAHEWSHESMAVIGRRRQLSGFSRQEAFSQEAREFVNTEGGLAEAERMLVGEDPANPLYPGADKWFQAARMEVDAEGRPLSDLDPQFALYKIGSEAWAEIGARKLLGDAVAMAAEAPKLSAMHEKLIVAEVGMFEQFNRIGEAMQIWRDQGAAKRSTMSAAETARKQRKRRVRKQGGGAAVATRSVKRAAFDDLAEGRAELERAEIAAGQEVGETPLSADPFRQRDRTIGTAAATAEQFIERSTVTPGGERTGESLSDVMRRVQESEVTPDEFKNFLNSVRGLEDYKKGLDTTLAKEDYVATLRSLYGKIPELKRVARHLKAYANRVVDFVEQSGGMTAADATKFKDGRHVYVTLLRVIEESGAGRRGAAGVGPKAAKGSGKSLFDLNEAMVAMTNHYVRQGLRAQVDQSFLRAARRGLGTFAEIVPKSAQPQKVEIQAFLDQIRKKATTLEELEAIEVLDGMSEAAITTFTGRRFPGPGDKLILPVVDRGTGKVEWVQTTEKAYDMATGADMAGIPTNVLARAGRGLATAFRKSAVEYNPLFAVGAAVKDMMFRPSVTRGGYAKKLRYGLGPLGHLVDLALGGKDMLLRTEFSQRLRATGMKTAGFAESTKQARNIQAELIGASRKIRKFLHGADVFASSLTTWTEHAPRLQAAKDVYRKSLETLPEAEAFQKAQEVYREEQINFAKGGTMLRAIGGYVPFAKASFLGQQKAFGVLGSKAGVAAAFANITVPAMMSYLFYKDEDWFKDLEDWEQRGYIHVTKDIRLPIPYELGYMFSTLPQLVADTTRRDERYRTDGDEWVALAVETFIPFLNDMRAAPPLLKSIVELKAGYDFFREKPIVPEWLVESRPPEEQVGLGTSEFAKNTFAAAPDFFQTIGIDNPAELAHITKGTIPGIAPHLVKAAESGNLLEFLPTERLVVRGGHMAKSSRQLKERMTDLKQRKKDLSRAERGELARLTRAKRKISKLWKDEDLTREDRSDQIREIAMQAMDKEFDE